MRFASWARLRRRFDELERTSYEKVAEAETAKAKLADAESSRSGQREAFQKELEAGNARVKGLNGKNKVLHSHLESASSQPA